MYLRMNIHDNGKRTGILALTKTNSHGLCIFQIHADLAIVPTSSVCGDPDAHLVNMLRHAILQVRRGKISTSEYSRYSSERAFVHIIFSLQSLSDAWKSGCFDKVANTTSPAELPEVCQPDM